MRIYIIPPTTQCVSRVPCFKLIFLTLIHHFTQPVVAVGEDRELHADVAMDISQNVHAVLVGYDGNYFVRRK